MADKLIYWDSCCFIGLIQQEAGRYLACKSLYAVAERGDLIIVTSSLTLAEVCKVRCERNANKKDGLPEENDHVLYNFFNNDFFELVDVSPVIATSARSLFRRHPESGKPNDALHLATALFRSVDEMHTFDGNDLLALNGQIQRRDDEPLPIKIPEIYQPKMTSLERAMAGKSVEDKDDKATD